MEKPRINCGPQPTADFTPLFDALLHPRTHKVDTHIHSKSFESHLRRGADVPSSLKSLTGRQDGVGKTRFVLASRDLHNDAEYRQTGRSRVFFDIGISHQKKGRVVFELVCSETLDQMYHVRRTP